MKNNTKIDWAAAEIKFDHHFGYGCQFPREARIDSEKDFKEFSDLIDKCIADNFDYTIEKYGTVPSKNFGLPKIIID